MKQAMYQVPASKKIRVIVDTDCNNEGDDQYALAHALMTPKFDVVGVVAAHYGNRREDDTEEQSYREVEKIVGLMGLEGKVRILHGCPGALADESTPVESEGSRFIVEEALREDDRPLFIVHLGPLTNLASAYLMNPDIAGKLTCIWIGGGRYPEGGMEFNLMNDINGANVVMDSSISLWQVPVNVYSLMRVSFAVLYEKVYPCGELGKYLVEQLMQVNNDFCGMNLSDFYGPDMSREDRAAAYPGGESWQLGDSPVVGLMLTDHSGHYELQGAPRFRQDCSYQLRPENPRQIRVYNYVDSHFILDDMYAKLKYYFGS